MKKLAAPRPGAIVALGFVLMFLVYAPNINLVGLFVAPMAESFGVSRTGAAFVLTVFTLTSTVTFLFAGQVLARFAMNRIMGAALVALCAAHFGISFAGSLPVVYLLSGVRGICNSLLTVVPISMAIRCWVPAEKNGKALGIAMAGSGLGAMLLNPVSGAVIDGLGWRWGYRLYGVLVLLLLAPVLLLFRLPKAEGATAKRTGGLRRAALPTLEARRVFFLLFFAYMFVACATQSFNVNGASFLGDIGYATTTVAAILALLSLGLLAGKLALGWLCDRLGARVGNAIGIGAVGVGYTLFILSARVPGVAWAGAVALGFGMATITILQPLTAGALFDRRNYGVLVSYLQLGSNFGSGLFPLVVSRVYDITGSYLPGWYALCAMLAGALGLVLGAYALHRRAAG